MPWVEDMTPWLFTQGVGYRRSARLPVQSAVSIVGRIECEGSTRPNPLLGSFLRAHATYRRFASFHVFLCS